MVLGEGNVIDPMGVGLRLGTEGGDGLGPAVGLGRVNDSRVATEGIGIPVQVPGAEYAVSAARVAVSN